MSSNTSIMSDGLTRQRRNLILISILLWFLQFGGVKVGKLSILGIEFEHFSNSSAVYVALWLGWLYFLIRYYQYFAQEGIPKLIKAYGDTMDLICSPTIRKLVLASHPHDIREDCGLHTLKKWDWTYHGQEEIGQDATGELKLNNYTMKISKWILWKEIIRSIWSISVNQSAITDYILPLVLAGCVLINGYSGWEGSFYDVLLK